MILYRQNSYIRMLVIVQFNECIHYKRQFLFDRIITFSNSFRIKLQQKDMNTLSVFEHINFISQKQYRELEKPILETLFTINSEEVNLVLTEHHIFLTASNPERHSNQKTTHYCELTFEIKFEILRAQWQNDKVPGNPIGIRLEKEKEKSLESIELLCSNSNAVANWERQLQKRINQRNFHKLFKAKKKIGKGAFATVYLAERLVDGKMFAVKAFSKERQYASDKGKQSLQNEIKVMRMINHRNAMKLESVFETENSIYFILEYFQGVQLNQNLKCGKKFSNFQIRSILKNILLALAHFSQNRIIHRDLKPENIMFRRDGNTDLAICDFGLATYADQESYLFVRCGTPGFVAPEIINIKDMSTKSDPISDVFSAGLIFHYLLFNSSVFSGKKYNQILAQNRSCQFNFFSEKYQSLSRECLDLLVKMLQKDPSKRISAEKALKHPYLQNLMEIEEETSGQTRNQALHDQTNTFTSAISSTKEKMACQTPSTFTSKTWEKKISFFEKYSDSKGVQNRKRLF